MERIRRQAKSGFAKRGFTLVELLVVIAIVLLASLVAIPVLSSLNGRQITDAARIFTGGLVGIRDSAIRYNEPRGIRLLPDPVLTLPAPGTSQAAGTTQLVYNRFIPIEPAGDYAEGKITISPQYYAGGTPAGFPPFYDTPDGNSYQFPFYESPNISQVLMVEESPYDGGFSSATRMPNSPTNWYWNVRVGDKIKVGQTGRAYTIVGPCVINPDADPKSGNQGNPERFVNVGQPGTPSPLLRYYYPAGDSVVSPNLLKSFTTHRPEFLFLVNGENDNDTGHGHAGWIDEQFDGLNNNPSPPPKFEPTAVVNDLIDDPSEFEAEKWLGAIYTDALQDTPTNTPEGSPSADWVFAYWRKASMDLPYIIKRRPVPSPGAREVMLPAGMVIDATTWNSTQERSRIPVEPGSLYCDIMVNPAGAYAPNTQHSTPAADGSLRALHFWLAERGDVHPVGTLPTTLAFKLPMPTTALGTDAGGNVVAPTTDGGFYPGGATGLPVLKGERRLVTMFAQTGLVVTNTIESIPPINAHRSGEGFNVADVNYPFYRAQQGLREAR